MLRLGVTTCGGCTAEAALSTLLPKAVGQATRGSCALAVEAMEEAFDRYARSNSGLRSQSSRVMLNGGLSPLRFTRKAANEHKDIRLISAGNSGSNASNATVFAKKLGQRSFPPKRLLTARRTLDLPTRMEFSTSSCSRGHGSFTGGGSFNQPRESIFPLRELSLDQNGKDVTGPKQAFLYRNQLQYAKRIVIKMGSAVITREDGNGLALGRLASIIEQVSELQNEGRECILITSGAVAFGKQKLAQEVMMSMSMRETIQSNNTKEDINALMKSALKKPNAAVGQSGLQALYETMFRNYGIIVGQVLVTKPDFYNNQTRQQLFTTIDELLQLNIIPIINTNDAVSPPPQKEDEAASDGLLTIRDNDSLAARVAAETKADLAILMSDVDGIYDRPPSDEDARIMHTFNPEDAKSVVYGEKSETGTGGMESKVESALWALENGSSVVICNGMKYNTIRKIMKGEKSGSFFTKAVPDTMPVDVMAVNARNGSRHLQSLSAEERASVIRRIASQLEARADEILETNKQDLEAARKEGVTGPLFDRLALTERKIQTLGTGLRQIADSSYNVVGAARRRTRISETMSLVQKTAPIGVLLVIFESRPDALPQVASLAIASANGLLMKGGREASRTNALLMSIVTDALGTVGAGNAIALVSSREAIGDLLKLQKCIDLVIPRGSSELVASIKEQSKLIPVLGHAEGVCHVYVDRAADLDKAMKIILDSKTDYPAACNAMETLLIHEDVMTNTDFFSTLCREMRRRGVDIFSGPNLIERMNFGPPRAPKLKHEYGDLAFTVETVRTLPDAIEYIHKYGSGHTDVIVTEDRGAKEAFLEGVDSACVFANCSSRMADGYRLGLGAEVGISTGRIHARGPVGVSGLLTTKWILEGDGDTASDYAAGHRHFLHQDLPIEEEAIFTAKKVDEDALEDDDIIHVDNHK